MALSFFKNDPFFDSTLSVFPSSEFSHVLDGIPLATHLVKSPLPSAAVDVKETADALHFVADLPGLKKEEVKVMVEGHVLSISGEKTRQENKNGDTWHRMERTTGKFMRQFQLPKSSDLGNISATSVDGVLTITVPKLPQKPQERKAIEINVQDKASA
jgi:HSP20 family protein